MNRTLLRNLWVIVFAIALMMLAMQPANADVTLPHIFGNNMVIQQGMPIKVWGWASPGETVSVSFGDAKAETQADEKGAWKLSLPAQKASSTAAKFIVKGNNEIIFDNVLVGEVWICSGQSNMSMGIKAAYDADKEIADADKPEIRLFVSKKASGSQKPDVNAQWKVCNPKTILEDGEIQSWYPNGAWRGFSAVGYFFGRDLQKELKVPVGMIEAAIGGTSIQTWYIEPLEGNARGDGANTLLKPIAPFQIRGAIWYQGEANNEDGMSYARKFAGMVAGWRKAWDEPEMPFYLVQTAPWAGYGFSKDPAKEQTTAPVFWEALSAITKLVPHTGIVGTGDIDLENISDIHPKKKQEVGQRLALQALEKTYGRDDIVADGPTFKSLSIEGSKIRIAFNNVPTGLKSKDGKPLGWFEILDAANGDFVKADAEIDGKTVVVSAPSVDKPLAVRFGWSKVARINLVSDEGLPVYPFRAADENTWRIFTAINGSDPTHPSEPAAVK